jgi:putative acetyltransferase
MIVIRPETQSDRLAVNLVNEAAFGRQDEAVLVDTLREDPSPHISLVAEEGEMIVGHIFFSVVKIESDGASFDAMGLAPMAVLPAYQNQGIGSQLVRQGLEDCRRLGYDVVVVVGHPRYYPRFGFVPASQKNLTCAFEVPDDVFMVAELTPGALDGKRGAVKYHSALNAF